MSERTSPLPAESPAAGPLPLVIGVTGHRDLRPEDVPFLEGIVRATFVDIRDKCPHSPLVLLSPLAEGGDRLTARVAVDMGIRLVVPLPLPKDVYLRDFETPESRAEFERLFACAESRHRHAAGQGNTPEVIRQYGPDRNRQYAMVGAYIARHSQLFIALWDGDGAGRRGRRRAAPRTSSGSASKGRPLPYAPPRSPLTFAEQRARVPHRHAAHCRTRPGRWKAFTRETWCRGTGPLRRSRASTRTWSASTGTRSRSAGNWRRTSSRARSTCCRRRARRWRTPSAPCRGPRASSWTSTPWPMRSRGTSRRRRSSASESLFVLVFVSALCFNIFHSFPHAKLDVEGLGGEGAAHAVVARPRSSGSSSTARWCCTGARRRATTRTSTRTTARWRKGCASSSSGRSRAPTDSVVDHYLRKQRGELEWIRSALDVMGRHRPRRADRASPPREGHADRLQMVRKLWVLDQRNYFKKKARAGAPRAREGRAAHRACC